MKMIALLITLTIANLSCGADVDIVGMNTFGESAPAKELFAYFGFTVDKVVEAVNSLIG